MKRLKDPVFIQWVGWYIFVLCAFFFIYDAARHGNIIGVIGSVIFLLANLTFMLALWVDRDNKNKD